MTAENQVATRPFDAVKSFANSVLAMLDERIKAAERNAHPFMDKFGDHPETIVAAKAQASELREVRTQVRILGDRALVDLMKFRPGIPVPEGGPAEPAPANSLPDYDECALRVANSDFIAQRVAEGGYGADPDTRLATQLHRFIHEYDDADPYRSAWFMHRLELLVNECREEGASAALAAPAPQAPAITEAEIDRVAALTEKAMEDGLRGFCRTWGWQQFARTLVENLRPYGLRIAPRTADQGSHQ